jgi:hypothetical protein
MKKSLVRPSPALVVAFVALIVALGGTAYAGLSIPKNSVGAKQLKKGAVTTKKIKNGAVTASKINTSGLTVPNAVHAGSATSAASATIAGSAQPDAFAHVGSNGVLDTANSKNVAHVTTAGTGDYCLSGIPFTPRGGQVTVDYNDAGSDTAQLAIGPGRATSCPAGTQAFVFTETGTSPDNAGFYVVLYG